MLSPHHPSTSLERAWRQRRSGLLVGLTLAAMAITIIGVSLLMAQPASSPMGGMSMAPANSIAPFDRQFIDMMVPHHLSATAEARIALSRGQHPQIKRLAPSIIAAQEAEIRQMAAWRKAWYGSATMPAMDHMPMLPHLAMPMGTNFGHDIAHLKTAKPFDEAFIDAMIPHHQMAAASRRASSRLSTAMAPTTLRLPMQRARCSMWAVGQGSWRWRSPSASSA